jgi:hypothetical protein
MGQTDILEFSGEARRVFMRALLYDLRALEHMLDAGLFEEGIARIGAEQECSHRSRVPRGERVARDIAELDDPHFTTERACSSRDQSTRTSSRATACTGSRRSSISGRARARPPEPGARSPTTGILPTIRKSDLGSSTVPLRATRRSTTPRRACGRAY